MQFNLTEEQVQRMVIILGNAPYKDVADIIDDIKAQVSKLPNKASSGHASE